MATQVFEAYRPAGRVKSNTVDRGRPGNEPRHSATIVGDDSSRSLTGGASPGLLSILRRAGLFILSLHAPLALPWFRIAQVNYQLW